MEDKLKAARELIARRDEIDQQLAALFGGGEPKTRKAQTCSKCGSPEHNARACTQPPPQ